MAGTPTLATVLVLIVAGCASGGTPVTVPPTALVPTSTVVAATTIPAPTTTTTAASTTTVDRVAEIEDIFQNLEERRLQALYEGDEETFKSLFANKEYLERSLGAFEAVEFENEPEAAVIKVIRVIHDGQTCLAAEVRVDAAQSLGPAAITQAIEVLERGDSNQWGYSYSGEGWACEGPHPFSP